MVANARDAEPARGADGGLPLLREAILRLVGTRAALARSRRELAAEAAWREGGARKKEDGLGCGQRQARARRGVGRRRFAVSGGQAG